MTVKVYVGVTRRTPILVVLDTDVDTRQRHEELLTLIHTTSQLQPTDSLVTDIYINSHKHNGLSIRQHMITSRQRHRQERGNQH